MDDDMLTRPIIVVDDRRSVSFSKTVLQVFAVVLFLGITVSIVSPVIGSRHQSLSVDRRPGGGGCDFPAIFNFGDSNSDTGAKSAVFTPIPYPNGETFFHRASGRYCDGKIILDFVAEKLDFPYVSPYLDSIGTNFRHGASFAVGGATIQRVSPKIFQTGYSPFSLKTQFTHFQTFKSRTLEFYASRSKYGETSLPRPEDFSKALYTLDIGQNDLDFGFNSMTVDELKASLPSIIAVLAQTVKGLYEEGGRSFWIHNTGPFGCLPYYAVQNTTEPENRDQIGCIKSYNEVAQEFNKLLNQTVFKLRDELSDAILTHVDVYSAKYSLISEATKHGFENPLGYCCGHSGAQCWKKSVVNGTKIDPSACKDPSKYISWDGVHYSHSANQWLAHKILEGTFSDPPIPITQVCYNTF